MITHGEERGGRGVTYNGIHDQHMGGHSGAHF